MKVSFTERIIESEVQIQPTLQKNKPFVSVQQSFDGMFFVVARTFTGARFYSDVIKSLAASYEVFKDYCGVASYFGGGEVELFAIVDDGYDLIRRENV